MFNSFAKTEIKLSYSAKKQLLNKIFAAFFSKFFEKNYFYGNVLHFIMEYLEKSKTWLIWLKNMFLIYCFLNRNALNI